MGGGTRRKKHKAGIFGRYIIYIISFLIISLTVTAAAFLIAEKPVTDFVHKFEDRFPMRVRDISSNVEAGSREAQYIGMYGKKTGNVVIDDCGVNCDVYYGDNRVSMRKGAGLHVSDKNAGDIKGIFLKGYDETHFAGLKYAKKGSVIIFCLKDEKSQKEITAKYLIKDIKYVSPGEDTYQPKNAEELVLCSIFSDFSKHSGEYLYIIADKADREVS